MARPLPSARVLVASLFGFAMLTACGGADENQTASTLSISGDARPASCAYDQPQLESRISEFAANDRWLPYSEGRPGANSSGHAQLKHIGKSTEWLKGRLSREPRIPAASSFPNLAVAEDFVEQAIASRTEDIHEWLSTPGSDRKLAFTTGCTAACGASLKRGARHTTAQYEATLVLHKECTERGLSFFVLTTYPGR